MSSIEFLERDNRRFYAIEAVCQTATCPSHAQGEWYRTAQYQGILQGPHTSQEYAETLLERVREQSPTGRYRLVEIEVTHQTTRRIL